MAQKQIDYNALGQAIDTSFGRSSTPKTASYSVKMSLNGPDQLLINFAAIVNFGSDREMIEMKRRYDEESRAIINEVLKSVKSSYKSLSNSSVTTKEVSSSDSLEMLSGGIHNLKRTAYYRRKSVFEIA